MKTLITKLEAIDFFGLNTYNSEYIEFTYDDIEDECSAKERNLILNHIVKNYGTRCLLTVIGDSCEKVRIREDDKIVYVNNEEMCILMSDVAKYIDEDFCDANIDMTEEELEMYSNMIFKNADEYEDGDELLAYDENRNILNLEKLKEEARDYFLHETNNEYLLEKSLVLEKLKNLDEEFSNIEEREDFLYGVKHFVNNF